MCTLKSMVNIIQMLNKSFDNTCTDIIILIHLLPDIRFVLLFFQWEKVGVKKQFYACYQFSKFSCCHFEFNNEFARNIYQEKRLFLPQRTLIECLKHFLNQLSSIEDTCSIIIWLNVLCFTNVGNISVKQRPRLLIIGECVQ